MLSTIWTAHIRSMKNDRDRLKSNRILLVLAAVAVIALAGFVVYRVYRLRLTISAEKERLAAAARVDVELQALKAPSLEGFSIYVNSSAVRAVASFEGATYLATSGGLIKLDASGSQSKRYTTSDGLPDNDLTALALF